MLEEVGLQGIKRAREDTRVALQAPAQCSVDWEPAEWTGSMSLGTQSSRRLPQHHWTELPYKVSICVYHAVKAPTGLLG